MKKDNETISICGAGPAGLVAAITLARAGRHVIVYERNKDVAGRFHDDLQGIENWTTDGDVLEELISLGVEINFTATPFHEAQLFDPQGHKHVYRSPKPMAYIVHRGSVPGSLDTGLKTQALAQGVEIRFSESCQQLAEGGIVAEGPHGADAIGVGYLFETDGADGAYIALSDDLAPQGYAYLLIQGGRGTVMAWIYSDFHNESQYRKRCLNFFQERVGLTMHNLRPTGGAANFLVPRSARKSGLLFVGEAAGFQDALWGFGMRFAMISGNLAARAQLAGMPASYDALWRKRLGDPLRAALVNRFFYRRLGNQGYQILLRSIDQAMHRRPDGRHWLHGHTAPRWWKSLFFPLAKRLLVSSRPTPDSGEEGCDCTWCRCRHQR